MFTVFKRRSNVYLRWKFSSLHGVWDTAVDVWDGERSHPATLRELLYLLGCDGPHVTLQVLLLHLHLLGQEGQQFIGAAHVENCIWEDWPGYRWHVKSIGQYNVITLVVAVWLAVPHLHSSSPSGARRKCTEQLRLTNWKLIVENIYREISLTHFWWSLMA